MAEETKKNNLRLEPNYVPIIQHLNAEFCSYFECETEHIVPAKAYLEEPLVQDKVVSITEDCGGTSEIETLNLEASGSSRGLENENLEE